MTKINSRRGFTLVEVMATVAVIATVTAISTHLLANAQERARDTGVLGAVEASVRETQNLAVASTHGLPWGWRCVGNSYTLFSFDPAQPELEVDTQTVTLPAGYTCGSSATDVRFRKTLGVMEGSGTVSATIQSDGAVIGWVEIDPPGTITVRRTAAASPPPPPPPPPPPGPTPTPSQQ